MSNEEAIKALKEFRETLIGKGNKVLVDYSKNDNEQEALIRKIAQEELEPLSTLFLELVEVLNDITDNLDELETKVDTTWYQKIFNFFKGGAE